MTQQPSEEINAQGGKAIDLSRDQVRVNTPMKPLSMQSHVKSNQSISYLLRKPVF